MVGARRARACQRATWRCGVGGGGGGEGVETGGGGEAGRGTTLTTSYS